MNVRAVAAICVVFIMVLGSISFIGISNDNVSADTSASDPVPSSAGAVADVDPFGELFDVLNIGKIYSDSGQLLTEALMYTTALPALGAIMALGGDNGANEGTTILIEEDVNVNAGDPTYSLGGGNTYLFRNQSWLSFNPGAKFTIDGPFKIEGNAATIMMDEGSILVIDDEEFVISARMVFTIAGTLDWDMSYEFTGGGTSLSATLSITFEGSVDINNKVKMENLGATVLSVNINVQSSKSMYEDITISEITFATLDLRLRLTSMEFLNKSMNVLLSYLSVGLVATVDKSAENYLTVKGDVDTLMKLKNPNDSGDLNTGKKITGDIDLTMPVMPTKEELNETLPLFNLTVVANLSDPESSSDKKDLTLVLCIQTSGDGDQRLLSASIRGKSELLSFPYQDELIKTTLQLDGLDIDMSFSVGAKFARAHISDPIEILDAADTHGHTYFKKITATVNEVDYDSSPQSDLQLDAYGLTVSLEPYGEPVEGNKLNVSASLMTVEVYHYVGEKQHTFFRFMNLSADLTLNEKDGLTVNATVDYLKYNLEFVLSDPMSLELFRADFQIDSIDNREERDLTVRSGRAYFGKTAIFNTITINSGVQATFDDLCFEGTSITVQDGADIRGNVFMDMVPGRTLTVSDKISVAFKEAKHAVLKVPLDGSSPLILPNAGYNVAECPSTADYVKYTIDDHKRGVAESSKGIFSVELTVSKSAVTINGTTNYYDAFSEIDLPAVEPQESKKFMGWYDGSDLYTTKYTVPARDVTFQEIWETKITKKDVIVDYENRAIEIDVNTPGVSIDGGAMDYIRYTLGNMLNGSITVYMPTLNIQFDITCMRMLYGAVDLWVGQADSRTMPTYAKSIGDGTVYRIHLLDAQGENHVEGGNAIITMGYNMKNTDYTVHGCYMDEVGRLTDCDATYDLVNKIVQIPTTHLSDFVVKETKDYKDRNSETDFFLFLAIVLIIATGVTLFMVTRRK